MAQTTCRLVSWKFCQQALLAFKTGLAALLCLSLGRMFGLTHSYWAAIAAIIIMGSDNSTTLVAGRDRLLGTSIGAFLGWIACYVWHGYFSVYALAVVLCVLVCNLLNEKTGRLAAVALTIIVLLRAGETPFQAAIGRFLEVSLGIGVALAINLVVPAPSEPTTKASEK